MRLFICAVLYICAIFLDCAHGSNNNQPRRPRDRRISNFIEEAVARRQDRASRSSTSHGDNHHAETEPVRMNQRSSSRGSSLHPEFDMAEMVRGEMALMPTSHHQTEDFPRMQLSMPEIPRVQTFRESRSHQESGDTSRTSNRPRRYLERAHLRAIESGHRQPAELSHELSADMDLRARLEAIQTQTSHRESEDYSRIHSSSSRQSSEEWPRSLQEISTASSSSHHAGSSNEGVIWPSTDHFGITSSSQSEVHQPSLGYSHENLRLTFPEHFGLIPPLQSGVHTPSLGYSHGTQISSQQNQLPAMDSSYMPRSEVSHIAPTPDVFHAPQYYGNSEDMASLLQRLDLNQGSSSSQSSGGRQGGLHHISTQRQGGRYDTGVAATSRLHYPLPSASSSSHHTRSSSYTYEDIPLPFTGHHGNTPSSQAMGHTPLYGYPQQNTTPPAPTGNPVAWWQWGTPINTQQNPPVQNVDQEYGGIEHSGGSPPRRTPTVKVEITEDKFKVGYTLLHQEQGRSTGIFVPGPNKFYTAAQLETDNPQIDPPEKGDWVMNGHLIIAKRGKTKYWQDVPIDQIDRHQQ